MPKLLLGDSDDDENVSSSGLGSLGGSNKLTINENYATAYERWRQKEEYQRLKSKYGEEILSEDSVASADDDDDDSEESDDSSDVDETIFDEQFLKVYGALKSRDPHIYDEKVRFFEEKDDKKPTNDDDKDDDDNSTRRKKEKSSKGMNLLEYHVNLVKKEKGITEEDRAMEFGDGGAIYQGPDKASYVQEMESIKKEFKNILAEDDNDDEDGNDLIKGVKKVQQQQEKRKPGPSEILRDESKSDQRIGFLANYWEKKDLDDREKFLKEYILQKKYLDPTDREDGGIPLTSRFPPKDKPSSSSTLVSSKFASSSTSSQQHFANANTNEDANEDEDGSDNAEDNAGMQIVSKLTQINEKSAAYHFQEDDAEVIKRYPREVESTRNLTGTTIRNVKRVEVKERKAKEKSEGLQRFRDLRRAEVKAKLEKLKEISGNERLLNDKQIDIDAIVDDITNFDPEKYDQCMSKLFDEQFYDVSSNTNPNQRNNLKKPKFDFIPGIDDVDDNLNPINQGEGSSAEAAAIEEEDIDGYDEDEDDDGGDDEGPSTSKGKKKKRENKKKTEKTPAEKKNIGIYEDLIAGEVPTRFRYRQVPANDFGLSPEELLFADDKELNRWASLKKTCQHRTLEEEKYDIKTYGRKANDYSLKKKILKSVYNPEDPANDDDDQSPEVNNEPSAGQSSKRRKYHEGKELEKINLTADRLRSYDLPFRAIKALKGKLHHKGRQLNRKEKK